MFTEDLYKTNSDLSSGIILVIFDIINYRFNVIAEHQCHNIIRQNCGQLLASRPCMILSYEISVKIAVIKYHHRVCYSLDRNRNIKVKQFIRYLANIITRYDILHMLQQIGTYWGSVLCFLKIYYHTILINNIRYKRYHTLT